MTRQPAVLCPIDFSDASRASLCYAAAIADHFGARLLLMTVDDPLLAEVAAAASGPSLLEETDVELRRFCDEILDRLGPGARRVEYHVFIGKPAPEILHFAARAQADLIVMSSHGRSGVRKLFFGSTTERVLRETTVPVLVTPDDRERPVSLPELAKLVQRVVAPVDLSASSPHQVRIAAGIASALSVPLILAHVMEPIFVPARVRRAIPGSDAERRAEAEEQLHILADAAADGARTEELVITGEPSEEIVKLVEARGAHLIVMGLHSSGMLGPRMGSVTYRILCLAHELVLAVPPLPATAEPGDRHVTSAGELSRIVV